MKNTITLVILALVTGIFSKCDVEIIAPSDLTVVFTSPSEVTLTWKDNSLNENNFFVFLKTLPQDNDFVLIKILDPNVTTFNDKGIISGTEYIYKVCTEISNIGEPNEKSCSNEVTVIGP